MAGVVQWLERELVVLDVAGSNPVARPIVLSVESELADVDL